MKRFLLIASAAAMLMQAGAPAAEPVGPKLTARLKKLITNEMLQVADATGRLSVAISTGDHETVHALGVGVRDSFILKQSLTAQDKKDLVGAVPAEFITLDRHFHALAGKLAHAGEVKDSALQGFYYSKMMETCVACHARFAVDKFPGLDVGRAGGHKH